MARSLRLAGKKKKVGHSREAGETLGREENGERGATKGGPKSGIRMFLNRPTLVEAQEGTGQRDDGVQGGGGVLSVCKRHLDHAETGAIYGLPNLQTRPEFRLYEMKKVSWVERCNARRDISS